MDSIETLIERKKEGGKIPEEKGRKSRTIQKKKRIYMYQARERRGECKATVSQGKKLGNRPKEKKRTEKKKGAKGAIAHGRKRTDEGYNFICQRREGE